MQSVRAIQNKYVRYRIMPQAELGSDLTRRYSDYLIKNSHSLISLQQSQILESPQTMQYLFTMQMQALQQLLEFKFPGQMEL